MPTHCNPDSLDFGSVEGRSIAAGFDGGQITSNAGALLLGAADKAIGLIGRFAGALTDARHPDWIEHTVPTLVGQRVRAGLAAHNAANPGSSTQIKRVLLMAEPASIDGGEQTDKGYTNQRATLERRADFVDRLYAETPGPEVIVIG